jgi:ABC-type nitrate/sulfonate/bicarbonate transport system ATPase subunit
MLNININCKKYKKQTIIKDFKLEIKVSEFISIIGPSGSGKTTLLNIISNLDADFTGEISFNNKAISDINIGFMFQDSRLIPWLSIYDNIALVSKNKDKQFILEALKDLNLEKYASSFPKELSGGMQRKVALIRAFINKPELILLDEPFISLDYPTAQTIRADFMLFYKKYKPTVIFVTHDLNEAISLSHRVVFLDSNPLKKVHEFINTKDSHSILEQNEIQNIKNDILLKYPNILSGKITQF